MPSSTAEPRKSFLDSRGSPWPGRWRCSRAAVSPPDCHVNVRRKTRFTVVLPRRECRASYHEGRQHRQRQRQEHEREPDERETLSVTPGAIVDGRGDTHLV